MATETQLTPQDRAEAMVARVFFGWTGVRRCAVCTVKLGEGEVAFCSAHIERAP